MSECASCRDLRAQLASLGTTIDRLSDANRVLAKECDEARAKLEQAEAKTRRLEEIDRERIHEVAAAYAVEVLQKERDQAEARARRLEEALMKYGRHTPAGQRDACAWHGQPATFNRMTHQTPCDCGLEAILAALAPSPARGARRE